LPKPRASRLESPTARLRLPVRRKPYAGPSLARGIKLLYRRNRTNGSWVIKARSGPGAYWTSAFAEADDYEKGDGARVLTFYEAQDAAKALARGRDGAPDTKPVTVSEAVDRYECDLKSRGADVSNARRVHRHMTSALAGKPVGLVTVNDLRHWRDGLVAKGVEPATINRTRAGLRAALELAAELDRDRIKNRDVFKSGLKGLRNTKTARRVVLPDANVLRIVQAAYEHDRAFGILIEVLAQTGARISQAARLRCGDLRADGPDPRLLMPTSYKGRGQKQRQQVSVPIPDSLAALLKKLRGDRPPDAPLLIKGDGTRWLEKNKSEQWNIFRAVAEHAGFDPDEITTYALRHSSICRSLLKGSPISLVARLHDTSSDEIDSHYAAYILDIAGDALSRKGLLQIESPVADNVVTLPGRRP
jgi:integrase